MNKDEIKYDNVFVWWAGANQLILHDKTVNEALEIAKEFGWKKPTWYTPWRYFKQFRISYSND